MILSKGTADFFAIDAYTVSYSTIPPNGIAACVADMSDPNWPTCSVSAQYDVNGWSIGPLADPGSSGLAAVPGAVRYELGQINTRWPTNKMVIVKSVKYSAISLISDITVHLGVRI